MKHLLVTNDFLHKQALVPAMINSRLQRQYVQALAPHGRIRYDESVKNDKWMDDDEQIDQIVQQLGLNTIVNTIEALGGNADPIRNTAGSLFGLDPEDGE